jgi:hypothetical protein
MIHAKDWTLAAEETLNWIAPELIFFGNSETMRMMLETGMDAFACVLYEAIGFVLFKCLDLTLDLYWRHSRENNRLPERIKKTLASWVGRTHRQTY